MADITDSRCRIYRSREVCGLRKSYLPILGWQVLNEGVHEATSQVFRVRTLRVSASARLGLSGLEAKAVALADPCKGALRRGHPPHRLRRWSKSRVRGNAQGITDQSLRWVKSPRY